TLITDTSLTISCSHRPTPARPPPVPSPPPTRRLPPRPLPPVARCPRGVGSLHRPPRRGARWDPGRPFPHQARAPGPPGGGGAPGGPNHLCRPACRDGGTGSGAERPHRGHGAPGRGPARTLVTPAGDQRATPAGDVFTIGHSTHALPDFTTLLRPNRIEQVADARTLPRSRRHPQFDMDA